MRVAILGASKNPERYSHMAFKMLREYGHTTLPVAPNMTELEGVPAFSKLSEVPPPIDTLTMYVNPSLSSAMKNEILQAKPKRVIFTPGTENPDLQRALESDGFEVIEGCTMVMLRTRQF